MTDKILIEKLVENTLYRYSKYTNFTASDIIHSIRGDYTGLPKSIAAYCRKLSNKKIPLDHGSGKKQIIYVKHKGQYGRTGRPQNLYKFKDAV